MSRALAADTPDPKEGHHAAEAPRAHQHEEKGFTLIELLVVILIIGILAAIALPAFLGQQKKGEDAEAKSNARNAVSQVESCYANEQDYGNCLTRLPTSANTGLPIDAAANRQGRRSPRPDGATGFTVARDSKNGNTFTIAKDRPPARRTRTCTVAAGSERGGRKNGNVVASQHRLTLDREAGLRARLFRSGPRSSRARARRP